MQQSNQIVANMLTIRHRLRYPPNAVVDRPIDLSKPKGVDGYRAARIRAQEARDKFERELDKRLQEALKKPLCVSPEAIQPIEIVITLDSPARLIDIKREVGRQWCVSVMDLESARRTWDIVEPRQIAMTLAKVIARRSLPDIARAFFRDHTTVLHAVRKYAWLHDELRAEMPDGLTLEMWVMCAKEKLANRKEAQNVE